MFHLLFFILTLATGWLGAILWILYAIFKTKTVKVIIKEEIKITNKFE